MLFSKHLFNLSVGEWTQLWYENYAKPSVRASTATYYKNYIDQHIVPRIGDIKLAALTTLQIQKFYNETKAHGRVQRYENMDDLSLSNKTIRGLHTMLRQCLEQAVTERLIPYNPANGCRLPKKEKKKMQIIPPEKIQNYLKAAEEWGVLPMFYLELSTGLRRGELVALQWDDLDFETGVLTISKQVSLVRGKIVMSVPKTKSSIRKLVLPPAAVQVLKEYRESVHSRWMFPSPVLEDMPLNPGSVYDRLQLILEHANCKQVRFHDLRHTFATLALQNGMDVKTLSAMLGHVSAATTLDIYTHSTSDMQHAAARKIDCGIGKAELPDEPAPQANAPAIVDFQPYMGKVRKPGTGCITQINDHLFEGRYSPTWIDGKKHARNVYAHTREECEEKLKVLIAEMKAELAELKRQKGDRH